MCGNAYRDSGICNLQSLSPQHGRIYSSNTRIIPSKLLIMAGSSSRDLHGPAENLASDEHSQAIADNTDSDDMDYEPATEEEEGDDLSDEGFLQRFLEEEEAIEEDGADEGELDSSILMFKLPANSATK